MSKYETLEDDNDVDIDIDGPMPNSTRDGDVELTSMCVQRDEPSTASEADINRDVTVTVTAPAPKEQPIQTPYCKKTYLVWLALVFGFVMESTRAIPFRLLHNQGVLSVLRTTWRSEAIAGVALPMCLWEWWHLSVSTSTSTSTSTTISNSEPKPKFDARTKPLWVRACIFTLSGVFWLLTLLVWAEGLNRTTIARASLFLNSSPMVMTIGYVLFKISISRHEIIGVVIAFAGLLIAATGNFLEEQTRQQNGPSALSGDLLCLFAAVLQATGVSINKISRSFVPLWRFIFCVQSFVGLTSGLYSLIYEGASVSFDHGDQAAIFGAFSSQFIGITAYNGIAVGLLGFAVSTYVLPLVPAASFTAIRMLEPMLAAVWAWWLGLDPIPSLWSAGGGVVAIVGFIYNIYAAHHRTMTVTVAAPTTAARKTLPT